MCKLVIPPHEFQIIFLLKLKEKKNCLISIMIEMMWKIACVMENILHDEGGKVWRLMGNIIFWNMTTNQLWLDSYVY